MRSRNSPTETQAQGTRLAEVRKQFGISQTELAQKVGTTREVVGRYERGIHPIGTELLTQLSLLGADVVYILIGKKAIPDNMLTGKQKEISAIYKSLSPSARTYALAFMRGLAAQTEAGDNG